MARIQPLGKPGSTHVSRLRVLPLTPGAHTGNPDTADATWATLQQGGGYDFGIANNYITPPPQGTISVPELSVLACYTPLANSGGACATHSFLTVSFDTDSTGFPFRPGDVILGGKMANFAPKSTESFAADPLDDASASTGGIGLIVVGWALTGHNWGTTDLPTLSCLVYNASAGSVTIPAGWLPPIYILRLGS